MSGVGHCFWMQVTGNWFGRCSWTFYIKFLNNDKSLLTKVMILSELSGSNTQQISKFKILCLVLKN